TRPSPNATSERPPGTSSAHRHVGEATYPSATCMSPDPDLLSGGGLEPGDHFSGYPAAVLHRDALRLGPLADPGAVMPARRRPAPAPSGPPGTAPGPPRRPHVACQRIPQSLGVPGVQVDLILGAV